MRDQSVLYYKQRVEKNFIRKEILGNVFVNVFANVIGGGGGSG
jgi:hypothetical protein